MKILTKCFGLLAWIMLGAGVESSRGATVLFQQGMANDFVEDYRGTSDAVLASNVSTRNGGGLDYFSVGRNFTRRAVVRFDLSSLSGEVASLERVSITLSGSGAGTSAPLTIAVYQLGNMNAGWEEGGGTLVANAASGEVTWSHLAYGVSPWAGSQGASQGGVDYGVAPLAVFTWNPGDVSVTFELSPEVAEAWLTQPALNAGLLFMPLDGADVTAMTANFASSEHAAPELRPLLLLEYTPIPEGAPYTLLGAGMLAFVGMTYRGRGGSWGL